MKRILVFTVLFLFIFGASNVVKASNKKGFSIKIKKISPSIKAKLKIKQKVFVWFSYQIPANYKGGIYIWVLPKSTKNIIIQPSPLIKSKEGTISRYFAITKGRYRLRKIWIRMMNKKQTKILVQKSIKVNFTTYPKSMSFKDNKEYLPN